MCGVWPRLVNVPRGTFFTETAGQGRKRVDRERACRAGVFPCNKGPCPWRQPGKICGPKEKEEALSSGGGLRERAAAQIWEAGVGPETNCPPPQTSPASPKKKIRLPPLPKHKKQKKSPHFPPKSKFAAPKPPQNPEKTQKLCFCPFYWPLPVL